MSRLPQEIEAFDDDALIRAVQQGDSGKFEPLVDRHLQHIRAFIALKAPVSQLVDEIAHDAFVFAYRNLHKYQPGTSFRAWLRAIAWNLLRAEIKRYCREQVNQARYTEYKLWELADQRCQHESPRETEYLQQCLEKISGPARELVALKYSEDRSAEDIAQRLKHSISWVRTVLFRVRQQLKDCIATKQDQEGSC